jgi:Transposase, Mutator family
VKADKATSISSLVVIGVREDAQKVLLALKNMGGETTEAWRAVLDDLVDRGLRRPAFLIVDGAPGLEKAIAAVWDGVPVQRCTVHKHRNLLAHAPERLHDEISAGLHEEFKRRIKTQTVLPSADTAAMLFWALLASGQINMRKVDRWQTLATSPIDQQIDPSLSDSVLSKCRRSRHDRIPTHQATAPRRGGVWHGKIQEYRSFAQECWRWRARRGPRKCGPRLRLAERCSCDAAENQKVSQPCQHNRSYSCSSAVRSAVASLQL